MPPLLWEIKLTDGKSVGVFATQHIKSGTVIMKDEPVFTVPFPAPEHAITQAFRKLSKETQDQLLKLHEGTQSHSSKFMRICQSNIFVGNDGKTANIYLNVSRVNHSCVPNATMCGDEPDLGYTRQELIASKAIQAGEEICICYTLWYDSLPARHRAVPMLARYGFVCSCEACSLSPLRLQLSNARRTIIGALSRALRGFKPDDLQWLDELCEPFRQACPDVPHPAQRFDRLEQPLSIQQETAYHFLLGV